MQSVRPHYYMQVQFQSILSLGCSNEGLRVTHLCIDRLSEFEATKDTLRKSLKRRKIYDETNAGQ